MHCSGDAYRVGLQRLGEAEVEDLHPRLAGDHQVARLQVPMDDVALVCGGEPLGDLDRDVEEFAQRDPARHLQHLVERPTLDVLHGDEIAAFELAELVYRGDVRMVEVSRRPSLALEERQPVAIV
jgi:hypothetical protein